MGNTVKSNFVSTSVRPVASTRGHWLVESLTHYRQNFCIRGTANAIIRPTVD